MDIVSGVLVFLLPVAFVAGVVDSIAGGGGMLMLPSLLLCGIPPHVALGTSKFASLWGTLVASINFVRKKLVWWPMVGLGCAFTWVGSFIGSRVILAVNEETAGKIIVGLFPIAVLAIMYKRKKDHHEHPTQLKPIAWKVILICLGVGFYDGFFGPGTGAFLAIAFYSVLHLTLLRATAHAKVFNLLSNVSAIGLFIYQGKVLFAIAIPVALANMTGAYVGSHLAIKKGDEFIRMALLAVLVLLLANVAWRFFR